jgi:phosphohistidine swiveling domain-containing protein/DNA-binding transcriptional ArsR family regulator
MAGLFFSETTQKILATLCAYPHQRFHVNDLIRKTGKYPYSVQHALKGLEKTGLVVVSHSGNRKFYQINTGNEIFPEVRSIFGKLGYLVETKLALLEKKVEWVKLMNRRGSLPFNVVIQRANRDYLKRFLGFSFKYGWFNGVTGGVYQAKSDLDNLIKIIVERVKKEKDFASQIARDCQNASDELMANAKKLRNLNLKNITSQNLAKVLGKFLKNYHRGVMFLTIPYAVEKAVLGDIEEGLKGRLSRLRKPRSFKGYFETLTTPSFDLPQRRKALEIADYVKRHGFNKEATRKISKRTKKYCFLPMFPFDEKPLTEEYFKEEIKTILRTIKDPKKEIERIERLERERREKVRKILRETSADRKFEQKVYLYQKFVELRTYRRGAIAQANFNLLPLLYEIARRMGLSKKEVIYTTFEEMLGFLKNGTRVSRAMVRKRQKGWAVLMWKGRIRIITGFKEIIEAMERLRIISEDKKGILAGIEPGTEVAKISGKRRVSEGVKELKGITAFKGRVSGRAKIVLDQNDFRKVREGDILIAPMTTPDYLSSLYKVAGFVVNESTMTSHAVLYAKALKIPAIVGTELATEVFRDGEKVELNATKGVIKKYDSI